MYIAIVIIELLCLFLLSNRLTNALYRLFMLIFRNNQTASAIITLIYLPGTVVHEFSHLLTAEILRVPTGELTFAPQIKNLDRGQQEITMGSVGIGPSDPIRKFLIGVAPMISGLAALLLLIWLWQHFYPTLTIAWHKIFLTVLISYGLFSVSNNMFSSASDIKEVWFLPIVLILIGVALYIAGVRINLTGQLLQYSTDFLNILSKALGIVLGVNVVVLLINLFILKNLRR